MIKNKLIEINKSNLQGRYVYRFTKRLMDIVLSSIGLLLLSPIFIIVAVAIKIDDYNGPVIYSQIRLGQHERPFRMFKFRSMVANADELLLELRAKNEVEGAMFKMKQDPRITRVGAFIRKHSIDELPQLVNVFLGQMSLVGPRPPLPREIIEYTDYDKQRLLVKPGCTGLWQVSGRNNVGFADMVQLDLKYVQKSTIGYDFLILLETVWIVLKPNGAY